MVTSRQFKSALIAALIFAASAYPGQAQPVSQAPAGNAVPVTADNFNRAETDMYFGKRVKRGGIGNLSLRSGNSTWSLPSALMDTARAWKSLSRSQKSVASMRCKRASMRLVSTLRTQLQRWSLIRMRRDVPGPGAHQPTPNTRSSRSPRISSPSWRQTGMST